MFVKLFYVLILFEGAVVDVLSVLQFLCLKNIRTFLLTCSKVFGLCERDLFHPLDLFEVKDFRKVCWDLISFYFIL